MNSEKLHNILVKCKNNDKSAQSDLYKIFSPKMFGVCRIYTNSYEDAQDAFQEAFITVFNKIHQFKGNGSIEGWIRRIMVNTCMGKHRKEKHMFVMQNENVPDLEEEEINLEYSGIDQKFLLDVIQQLPERYQIVFNLYVLEDYSHKQIAEELNITIGTSKSNLSRARTWLKERLKKKLEENTITSLKIANE